MDRVLNLVARWFLAYGHAAGSAPSFRGSYEAPVPECLKAVHANKNLKG